MVPHPFGYIAVIVVQQIAIVGLAWWIAHILERPSRPNIPSGVHSRPSAALASHDLAALALQLERHSEPAPSADWSPVAHGPSHADA